MAELVVVENVTLDGVAQAPGRADEDPRGGFTHGGWAVPYSDPAQVEQAQKAMATTSALLFGRRTYLDFHSFWPNQADGNPFTDVLNETPKYVVSRTLTGTPWRNSTLLRDVTEVAALKERLPGAVVVLGSLALVGALGPLVDRFVLSVHPLALGTGQRLALPPSAFDLVSSVVTGTGVIIATYARTTP
jgi:dihydrofolate reductase